MWWARRSIAGLGRARGITALALRIAIVTLLALALAQAQWSFIQNDLSVIYVLDQSLSIPTDTRREALDYVMESQNRRQSADQVGLVVFGKSAAMERRPEPTKLLETAAPDKSAAGGKGETASLQSLIMPERTNIAAALRLALAAFPSSARKRVVLVSDGNENMGTAMEEAESARRNDVRIDVLPVRYSYSNEVMVEKVIAPPAAQKGASFEVRAVVTTIHPQKATLRVFENGGLIGSQAVELKEGRNVFVVQRKLPEPGYYTYTASVESADDALYENNQAGAFTMVRGQGRVLCIEGDPQHGEALRQALAGQGLDVKAEGLDGLPLALGKIVPYDALVLSNVPASSLGEEGMRAVELAVKDWGVGLVMIGGENSFGPGGYQDSPVERTLPVSMEVKQQRVMPSGALVIILHTCEIAQGNYWAQQIALAALNVLSSSDEFGVLYYDWSGGVKWLFNLQRASDKGKLASLIGGVQPGDMPDFAASFQQAHAALKASSASIKHVVVISDGDPAYPSDAAVNAITADKITISAVGISPHSATDTNRLAHIAQLGKGRYYEPLNPNELPQIFIKEAAMVRRSMIFEEIFTPRAALVSELTRGIDPGEYPPLNGYVVTTPKQLAEVPLVTHHQDPLLAHWQYGLGRSAAFTSDAKARWAAQWVPWEKFAPFWAQVIRWCSRSVETAPLSARTEVSEDRARVVIDAADAEGRFLNNLQISGTMITPDGREERLAVEQTGPGRYETTAPADRVGPYYLSMQYTDDKGVKRLYTSGLVVPYSSEYRELKTNDRLLEELAKTTQGRVLKPADDVFARTFAPAPQFKDAWPLLLLIAVLLAPADIFVRRVFLDYARIWALARAALAAAPVVGRLWGRPAEAPTHVTTLLDRKRLSREEIAKRAQRFKPGEGAAPVVEPGLGDEAEKPRIEPLEQPKTPTEGPAVAAQDDTYTGRLLRAKRKFRDKSEEK